MRQDFAAVVAAAVFGFLAASAHAEEPACASFAWPLTRELALLDAKSLRSVELGATIRFGEGVGVALRPMADVAFAAPPERLPKIPASFAALLRVEAPAKAALYQVTLSEEAWIDVVQDGARLRAGAFSGKTGCPGMRKTVRFDLSASPAVVQISGAAADRINVVVTPAD